MQILLAPRTWIATATGTACASATATGLALGAGLLSSLAGLAAAPARAQVPGPSLFGMAEVNPERFLVVADALARGKQTLTAAYRPTAKNAQVADFYDRLGLRLSSETADGARFYTAELATVQLVESAWVELRDG
jgi:hypothetical protein